jgi:hypothetical protein
MSSCNSKLLRETRETQHAEVLGGDCPPAVHATILTSINIETVIATHFRQLNWTYHYGIATRMTQRLPSHATGSQGWMI